MIDHPGVEGFTVPLLPKARIFQLGRTPIDIESFRIDTHEVSFADYQKFCERTGHRQPLFFRDRPYDAALDALPAVGVTWADARAFAEWSGRRLPTHAEWEYAARGTEGRRFPWGDNETLAWEYKPGRRPALQRS